MATTTTTHHFPDGLAVVRVYRVTGIDLNAATGPQGPEINLLDADLRGRVAAVSFAAALASGVWGSAALGLAAALPQTPEAPVFRPLAVPPVSPWSGAGQGGVLALTAAAASVLEPADLIEHADDGVIVAAPTLGAQALRLNLRAAAGAAGTAEAVLTLLSRFPVAGPA